MLFSSAGLLSCVQAGQVNLAWDPNSETDLNSYKVFYGTKPGIYGSQTNVGLATNVIVSGLTTGSTYYFAVKAVNISGLESEPSNEVSGQAVEGTRPSGATTKSFGNAARIVIRDNNTAAPYPSLVSVSGMPAILDKVTVSLTNLNHSWLYDVKLLLVGPNGKKVQLLREAGWKSVASRLNLAFDDSALKLVPLSGTITSGVYRPSNYGSPLAFSSPAPSLPYATNLNTFAGSNPNGNWQLYVMDTGAGDYGEITGGWGLAITARSSTSAGLLSVRGAAPVSTPIPNGAAGESSVNILSIWRSENQPVRLQLKGAIGQAYRLQRTGDLANWSDIAEGVIHGEIEEVIDPDLMGPDQAFYRVITTGEPSHVLK